MSDPNPYQAPASPPASPLDEAPSDQKGRKLVAIVLSLVCGGPGAGHFVLGRWARGIVWAAGYWVVCLAAIAFAAKLPLGIVGTALIVSVAAAVDVGFLRPRARLPSWGKALLCVGGLVGAGIVMAMVARVFLLEAFRNPSGSMMPTLMVDDNFFVDKTAYGPSRPPARGDVAVFKFPENKAQDFVKRVIALPGEKLEVVNGRPILNGTIVPHCYVGSWVHKGRSMELYVEYLGDRAHLVIHTEKTDEKKKPCTADGECVGDEQCRDRTCATVQGPFVAAPGEVWVIGDNRDNSHDSRSWRGGQGGGVPFDLFKGRAMSIFFSDIQGRAGHDVMGAPVIPESTPALDEALQRCLRERPAPTAH